MIIILIRQRIKEKRKRARGMEERKKREFKPKTPEILKSMNLCEDHP